MDFKPNNIYHIYNRGNNSQNIFFLKENYLFFLKKIRKQIVPHGDILSWCLMPTHFHLMVYVNKVEIEVISKTGESVPKKRTLNDSISILLRSYTRAINVQEERTGSLFQNRTKAINVASKEGLSSNSKIEYPQTLFNYIHANPVKDGLVDKRQEWEFSSYIDYLGKRDGDLINRSKASEIGLTIINSAGEL